MGELAKATTTWRQAHFGAVISRLLQLSCSSSYKSEIGEGATCSPQRSDPVEVQKFWLDDVKTLVCTTQSHYSTVWHHQCAGQYQCQGSLHGGSCPHRTGAWSPVASGSGTYSYLWGTMSWFLKSTSLPVQLECPCCGSIHKRLGWTGFTCQPSATSGPPNQDCQRDKQSSVKRIGLWGSRPPKSHWVAWIRAEPG